MKINVAVCDNDRIIRELLKEYFSRYEPENNVSYEVSYFSDGLELLNSYDNGNYYHLVILDIEMPGLNGVEAAQKIQDNYDFNVLFVFITNYPENMHSNFAIQPRQYWIKPLAFNDFTEHMSFLSTKINISSQELTFTCVSGENVSLRPQDIIYVEKHKKNGLMTLHTMNSQYVTNVFRNLELFENLPFVNPSDYILINLNHIKSFHKKSVELSDGFILKLSPVKEKELKTVFFNFMMSK